MHITTNEAFVRKRSTIGWVASLAGILVLGAGVYVYVQYILQQPDPAVPTWVSIVPYITFAVSYVLTTIGKQYTARYGGRPRIDVAVAQSLKGLDSRNHLFNFLPTVPARHVLVTPNAVVVIDPRSFVGEVTNTGRKWRRPLNGKGIWDRFSEGGIGNPTTEAQNDASSVESLLRERLGDDVAKNIVVLPIIVCTNPRLTLHLSDPEVPVVMLADLRGALKKLREGTRLSSDVQRHIIQVFQPGTQSILATEATTRSKTWQRTQK